MAEWIGTRVLGLLSEVADALEVDDGGEVDEERDMRLAIALAMATPRCVSCGWQIAGSTSSPPDQPGMVSDMVIVCRNEACDELARQVVFAAPVSALDAIVVATLQPASFGRVS